MRQGTRVLMVAAVLALAVIPAAAAAAEPIAESGMTMPAPLAPPAVAPATDAGAGGSPFCEGDGQSGSRIQAVYGHVQGTPNSLSVPIIEALAGHVDEAYDMSAARQSGSAHPRWAFDQGTCDFSVLTVELPADAPNDFDKTVQAMSDAGLLARTDRKYIVWVDGNGLEGLIANSPTEPDDTDPATQAADGGQTSATVAQVTRDNWDDDRSSGIVRFGAQHELSHMLGAVNPGAPHYQNGKHCTDDYDAMCFGPMTAPTACPQSQWMLLDCGNDDYFAVNPGPGNYLDTHWNTYDSSFLVRSDTPDAPPDTTLTGGPGGTVAVAGAQFTFSSNEPGGFECRLDGGAFSACASPASYAGLADGPHRFAVRAKDAAGNLDFTPAERAWTVRVPGGNQGGEEPDTRVIKAKVKAKRRSAKITFAGSGGTGQLSYECKLDDKPFEPCSSPLKLKKLKPGEHLFSVRAVDANGADPTPATKKLKLRK